jgi:succinoglycan biosynthesis protein ExoA
MASRVLVVIPTLNEAKGIEQVLSDLGQDLPSNAATTFVVADGGSTDSTAETVARIMHKCADLHLLPNPKRIQGAAVNQAVRRFGRGFDVLIRCDAHALYPPGFVRRLLDTLDRTGADSVVVPMDSVGESCLQKAVAWVSDTPVGSGGSAHRGGRRSGFVDHGHHAVFRMDRFRRAGGYDETFTHNEDAEFDCRQRELGARIYLDAEIRLAYRPRATFGGLWQQYFAYGRGRSRTVRRHPRSVRARQLAVPAQLALTALALIGALWTPLFLWWPALYLALLSSTSMLLAMRHRSVCGLLSGPAAFVMHTAWALGFYWGLLSVREQLWRPEAAAPLWLDSTVRDSA